MEAQVCILLNCRRFRLTPSSQRRRTNVMNFRRRQGNYQRIQETVKRKAGTSKPVFSCLTKLHNSAINYQLSDNALMDMALSCLQRVYDHWRPTITCCLQTYHLWLPPRGAHSGVVQQAGHAALDRRIGVRIPAPELHTPSVLTTVQACAL